MITHSSVQACQSISINLFIMKGSILENWNKARFKVSLFAVHGAENRTEQSKAKDLKNLCQYYKPCRTNIEKPLYLKQGLFRFVVYFPPNHSIEFNKWTKVRYPSSEICNMWFKMSHIFGGWGIFVCCVSKNKTFHTYTFGPSLPWFHSHCVCIHCKIFIGNHRTVS